MPRGERKKPFEQQINDIDLKIQELQESKKQLLQEKGQEDIRQLLEAAKSAGITPSELVKQLVEKKGLNDFPFLT